MKIIILFSLLVSIYSSTTIANENEIRDMWNTMTPGEQKKIRKRYERFKRMSPERRERIKRRHKWFQALPPKERARLKAEFKELRNLPKQERRKKRRKLMKQLRERYQTTQRSQ
ncbi:MAG: DUF3106 domain-containing protein [Oligoflexia bacterium]|nr:DUF3106 domain-containing protein [Oligoflexia bacterium]